MSANLTVPGAPAYELRRSPAAARVGDLAVESGLFLAHFEHRVHLPLPDAWLPEARADLSGATVWHGGDLPEPKYQCFRHDLMVGSFHPGHRAKWTAHELCHGLVGFAWQPGASRLFHALAARLAEALPVALWYFLDEAGLRRCAEHQGDGPLHGRYCVVCEEAAHAPGAEMDGDAERWRVEGVRFVHRELERVAQSATEGRPIPHRLGPLDLSSDGLAYAAAHAERLGSDVFHRFVELFFQEGQGLHANLEALQARVLEVLSGIVEGAPVKPLSGGRWRWVSQDLGWRLLQVASETGGEAQRDLHSIAERLASRSDLDGVAEAQSAYGELAAEWVLPEPEDVFAVGYELPGGQGRSVRQVADGIASACPRTWDGLGEKREEVAGSFLMNDAAVRDGIGRRFASYARKHLDARDMDLSAFEAALSHPEAADSLGEDLVPEERIGDSWRVPRGVELLRVEHDVGEPSCAPLPAPLYLALWRRADGDVHVAELEEPVWEALSHLKKTGPGRAPEGLEPNLGELAALRLIQPVTWVV